MDIIFTDISLLWRKGSDQLRSEPFPVFGFLDEIKEISADFAIRELEFFRDDQRGRQALTGPFSVDRSASPIRPGDEAGRHATRYPTGLQLIVDMSLRLWNTA